MRMLSLFLNYSCNARCGFCFNPAAPPQREWLGISTRRAVAAMIDAYADGCRCVSFIGGEVTVRGDFLKLIAAARRLGFEDIRLVTNGLRLSEPDYVDSLVRAGLSAVELSVHAHLPEIHDRLLGVPGAYEKAMSALAHLRGRPVRLGLNIVVNRQNYRLLPEMTRHFARVHGVRNFSFFSLRYIGHMDLPGNISELKIEMSRTAPFVRGALEVLEREGCLATTCLGDFVPCVLPGYESLMTDWEAGANLDRVCDPSGRVEDSDGVCSDGKRQVAACGLCVFKPRCLGVNGPYLAIFGDAEFSPVRGDSAPKAARPERLLS